MPAVVVELAAKKFALPYECPCCGAVPDGELRIPAKSTHAPSTNTPTPATTIHLSASTTAAAIASTITPAERTPEPSHLCTWPMQRVQ
jgi:hypothetical protein